MHPPLLLSICILTYNRAETLRKTLASILPQVSGNPAVEVVISDNASTDDTSAVCRELASRFPGLRYCVNPRNLGFDGNVVACVEKAQGEYLSFFSDDDLAPPGAFPVLLELLARQQPAVIYINHAPFLHRNPEHRMKPLLPTVVRTFYSGKEFLFFAGLGFLSALTVRTEAVRRHIGQVALGRCTAHLDLALRATLTHAGPFLYVGNLVVLGRYDYDSQYDILTCGPMNVTRLYQELHKENLLTAKDVFRLNRGLIRHSLPRCVLNNRCRRVGVVPRRVLAELYGQDWLFYIWVYPLLLVPPALLRPVSMGCRALLHRLRRLRYGPGTMAVRNGQYQQ